MVAADDSEDEEDEEEDDDEDDDDDDEADESDDEEDAAFVGVSFVVLSLFAQAAKRPTTMMSATSNAIVFFMFFPFHFLCVT